MSMLLRSLDKGANPLENALNLIAALAIFLLMTLGILQIGLRSIFNTPIVGYIDLVELSMASMAFLGAAYCQRLGGHIRMDVLIGKLRGRPLWLMESLGVFAGLFVVVVLAWYGWDHFMRAYEIGDTTIDAEFPVWPSKLLVPVAFSFWALRLTIQLLATLRMFINPKGERIAVVTTPQIEDVAQQEIQDIFGDEDDQQTGRAT